MSTRHVCTHDDAEDEEEAEGYKSFVQRNKTGHMMLVTCSSKLYYVGCRWE